MSELNEKLQSIKLEKDKLTPDILSKGNTILGINGVNRKNLKIFEDEESMQNDPDMELGDTAIIKKIEESPMKATDKLTHVFFPETVILEKPVEDKDIFTGMLESDWESGDWASGNFYLRKESFSMDCYGNNFNVNIQYKSEDGIAYNRITEQSEAIFSTPLMLREYEYENFEPRVGEFIKTKINNFKGIFNCSEFNNGRYFHPVTKELVNKVSPEKIFAYSDDYSDDYYISNIVDKTQSYDGLQILKVAIKILKEINGEHYMPNNKLWNMSLAGKKDENGKMIWYVFTGVDFTYDTYYKDDIMDVNNNFCIFMQEYLIDHLTNKIVGWPNGGSLSKSWFSKDKYPTILEDDNEIEKKDSNYYKLEPKIYKLNLEDETFEEIKDINIIYTKSSAKNRYGKYLYYSYEFEFDLDTCFMNINYNDGLNEEGISVYDNPNSSPVYGMTEYNVFKNQTGDDPLYYMYCTPNYNSYAEKPKYFSIYSSEQTVRVDLHYVIDPCQFNVSKGEQILPGQSVLGSTGPLLGDNSYLNKYFTQDINKFTGINPLINWSFYTYLFDDVSHEQLPEDLSPDIKGMFEIGTRDNYSAFLCFDYLFSTEESMYYWNGNFISYRVFDYENNEFVYVNLFCSNNNSGEKPKIYKKIIHTENIKLNDNNMECIYESNRIGTPIIQSVADKYIILFDNGEFTIIEIDKTVKRDNEYVTSADPSINVYEHIKIPNDYHYFTYKWDKLFLTLVDEKTNELKLYIFNDNHEFEEKASIQIPNKYNSRLSIMYLYSESIIEETSNGYYLYVIIGTNYYDNPNYSECPISIFCIWLGQYQQEIKQVNIDYFKEKVINDNLQSINVMNTIATLHGNALLYLQYNSNDNKINKNICKPVLIYNPFLVEDNIYKTFDIEINKPLINTILYVSDAYVYDEDNNKLLGARFLSFAVELNLDASIITNNVLYSKFDSNGSIARGYLAGTDFTCAPSPCKLDYKELRHGGMNIRDSAMLDDYIIYEFQENINNNQTIYHYYRVSGRYSNTNVKKHDVYLPWKSEVTVKRFMRLNDNLFLNVMNDNKITIVRGN